MLKSILRRSQLVVGLARTLRGLKRDVLVLVWLTERRRKIHAYLRTHEVRKLQLATSNNVLPGWLNTDIFLNHKSVVYLDVTRRFPFDDQTFDYIIAEHMIEHVDYQSAQVMLKECSRILKPGGRLRVATPDLGVILELRSKDKTESQKRYIEWAASRFVPDAQKCKDVFVINNCFRAWGHSFLYDREMLLNAMSDAGFKNVVFYRPGISDDVMLKDVESHGKEIGSEDMNEFETIVAEACKAA